MLQTQSFKIILRHVVLKNSAIKRNPFKRLTTPEDIANVVSLLSLKESNWINGTVIKADGGESL